MKKLLILIFALGFVFSSCQKEIELDIPEYTPKLVVEGWIENGQYPIVLLTRSSSFFSHLDSTYFIDSLFVKDALVVVSDGVVYDTLKFTLDFNAYLNNSWPMIYYKGSKILGAENGSYTLHIEADNKVINGNAFIPKKVGFDSLYWMPDPAVEGDTLGLIYAVLSDPPNEKNYYRIFAKRLGKDYNFISVTGSLIDDVYIDGKPSFTFNIIRGEMNYRDEELYEDPEVGYFKRGDTVVVKISSITMDHYLFWRTFEENSVGGGNPFTNPMPLKHNVSGAIGVFGGYGSQYDTVVIK